VRNAITATLVVVIAFSLSAAIFQIGGVVFLVSFISILSGFIITVILGIGGELRKIRKELEGHD
jgi:hypothetical protein